jgi:TolA-binding protein
MESNEQIEPQAPVVAEAPRAEWKSPMRWPGLAIGGIKQIPKLFLEIKNIHRWSWKFVKFLLAHKVMSLLVSGSAVAIILPVLTYFMVQNARREQAASEVVKPEQVYAALDRGANAQVKILAKRLMTQKNLPKSEAGVATFALGAIAVFEAEKLKGKNRQTQYLLASRYLAEADLSGFPEVHRAEGLYLYGKSLYEIGDYSQCCTVLAKAMKVAPQHKSEIYGVLAKAYLNESKPKLSEAMAQNTIFLSDKQLSAADRQMGLLQKARIQLAMDQLDDCRATLKEIPENSAEAAAATIVAGQVSMREGELLLGKGADASPEKKLAADAKFQEAIKTLRLAESRTAAGNDVMRRAQYLIGVCFMESGDNRAANDQFIRLHKTVPETPEGAAAGLQQAEISRRVGHDMEMLSEYRHVLAEQDQSIPFRNPWILPDELKSRLMNAYQEYQNKQQFEVCLQLIRLIKSLMPEDQTQLMLADLRTKWGQYLLGSAEKAAPNKRESIRRMGREQFRRAGKEYAALAQMHIDKREYPDDIWSAAMSYLQGHDYARSVDLLKTYMQNEMQRRRPQALECLGEALLNLGQYDAALESLKECIDLFPRDAAACQARFLAAQVLREKGDLPEAEKILLANLNGEYLTPASKEWRDSLILLGEVLHRSGRYDEAERRLEEAVKRYPDLPETIEARYLLADSYCRLAYAMQDELNKDVAGSSRATKTKQIRGDFDKALEQYHLLQQKLESRRGVAEMSPSENAMLRNSFFAVGDVLYTEGEYAAALKAYSLAANRYQNRPEVLDAYVQMANCYRQLDKAEDAYNTLQQAKLLLARMKPEVPFAGTSIYTREEWSKRLDELQARGGMKG